MSKEVQIEVNDESEELDLDALIAEGMLIKAAMRNKALGRKNKPEEEKAIRAAGIAIEIETWDTEVTIAVFKGQQWSDCIQHFPGLTFLGKFQYQIKRKGNPARRLVRLPDNSQIAEDCTELLYSAKIPCPHCLYEKTKEDSHSNLLIPADLLEALK